MIATSNIGCIQSFQNGPFITGGHFSREKTESIVHHLQRVDLIMTSPIDISLQHEAADLVDQVFADVTDHFGGDLRIEIIQTLLHPLLGLLESIGARSLVNEQTEEIATTTLGTLQSIDTTLTHVEA